MSARLRRTYVPPGRPLRRARLRWWRDYLTRPETDGVWNVYPEPWRGPGDGSDFAAPLCLTPDEAPGMLISELLDESTLEFIRKRDARR